MTKNFFDFTVQDIHSKDFALREFKGKTILVVNTASKCGYTPQYKGLQTLHDKYASKGLVVLGFPSNDFGKQEPAPNAEIAQFCELNFGVSFPLFAKAPVSGPEIQPVFKWLTEEADSKKIQWNFEKFLIGKEGNLLKRFDSEAEPTGKEIVSAIEASLK